MGNKDSGRERQMERHKERRIYVGVHLDYSDKAALNRIAKRDKKTVSELVRTYIVWGIEADDKR